MRVNRKPLTEVAGDVARTLWEGCKDRQVVVWLDNFYRRRHCTDPGQDDLSLNSSVLAVMKTINFRPFPGHPHQRDVVEGIPTLANSLWSLQMELTRGIGIVNAQPMQSSWIRVPLDIQRSIFITHKSR